MSMKREFTAALVGAAALIATSAAVAHHSTAMFDQENPVELVGVVKEFKFTNPFRPSTKPTWRIRPPAGTAPTRPIPAFRPECRVK